MPPSTPPPSSPSTASWLPWNWPQPWPIIALIVLCVLATCCLSLILRQLFLRALRKSLERSQRADTTRAESSSGSPRQTHERGGTHDIHASTALATSMRPMATPGAPQAPQAQLGEAMVMAQPLTALTMEEARPAIPADIQRFMQAAALAQRECPSAALVEATARVTTAAMRVAQTAELINRPAVEAREEYYGARPMYPPPRWVAAEGMHSRELVVSPVVQNRLMMSDTIGDLTDAVGPGAESGDDSGCAGGAVNGATSESVAAGRKNRGWRLWGRRPSSGASNTEQPCQHRGSEAASGTAPSRPPPSNAFGRTATAARPPFERTVASEPAASTSAGTSASARADVDQHHPSRDAELAVPMADDPITPAHTRGETESAGEADDDDAAAANGNDEGGAGRKDDIAAVERRNQRPSPTQPLPPPFPSRPPPVRVPPSTPPRFAPRAAPPRLPPPKTRAPGQVGLPRCSSGPHRARPSPPTPPAPLPRPPPPPPRRPVQRTESESAPKRVKGESTSFGSRFALRASLRSRRRRGASGPPPSGVRDDTSDEEGGGSDHGSDAEEKELKLDATRQRGEPGPSR